MTERERLRKKLHDLRLHAMAAQLDEILDRAGAKNNGPAEVLAKLADIEAEHRWHNSISLRWRQSALNEKLTIDQFDFHHHSSRNEQKTRLLNLFSLDFVSRHMDVILIGNPGTGKTFIAKALAYAACNANIKVLFTTAMDMINNLIAAEADRSLLKKLTFYQTPELLVCDELGYLSLGQQGSNLFFQVISHRHKQKSTMLTTNLPFTDWGNVFDSTTVATAIADRLVHNSEVLVLGGKSYRRKEK
ncbi:MAG: IS21-like element helper ATPase IstB [Thermodesulfobacteriota bacterium]